MTRADWRGNSFAILGNFTLLIAAGWLAACGGHEAEQRAANPPEPVSVRVERIAAVAQPQVFEAVGTVKARVATAVSSRIMSYIRAIHVDVGARVGAGQLLVELDDQDLQAKLRQAEAARTEVENAIEEAGHALGSAEAQLRLAQVTHRRFSDLLAKKSVSQSEYDEADARLKSAQAAVEMAQSRRRQAEAKRSQVEAQIADVRVMTGYAKIHAPFAGIVTERPMDPGSLASPGMPILMIERAGGYRLEASVPESKQSLAHAGQTVAVRLEAIGEALEGRVDEIVPQVDSASRTILVKIALPNVAGLRSGMYGRAVFPAGDTREALTVPQEAVMERGQIQSVFVVDGGIARRRLVTLSPAAGERREVLSGLTAGEQVVLAPDALTDGHPVRVGDVVEPPTAAAEAGSRQ